MEHVLGIGGYFVRAADPPKLVAWYRDLLGVDFGEHGVWQPDAGPVVFAAFDNDDDYLGAHSQRSMINFRVRDLDAMLAQLRDGGAKVDDAVQDHPGIGRFGWVTDPEGNRVELWQLE